MEAYDMLLHASSTSRDSQEVRLYLCTNLLMVVVAHFGIIRPSHEGLSSMRERATKAGAARCVLFTAIGSANESQNHSSRQALPPRPYQSTIEGAALPFLTSGLLNDGSGAGSGSGPGRPSSHVRVRLSLLGSTVVLHCSPHSPENVGDDGCSNMGSDAHRCQ